eukprot:CAMPEP_0119322074 /NCGR_PEP_ID=MMETSP1333-20130426/57225_1 /TAXON_ID=418940 /ORGANISM="Scyphosphaera apsteinii, Strain RCC1455" /LENGTH=184 /DNA_ID=CAMNT_0007329209 /DNA_START=15 /DNA_END=569 /DNA_ORIENTATION=-
MSNFNLLAFTMSIAAPCTRRAVLGRALAGTMGAAPALQAACALSNPFDKGDIQGLKAEVTCKPKGSCPCNCMPDGFGGYKERKAEVKPAVKVLVDTVIDDEADQQEAKSSPKPSSVGLTPPPGYNSAKPASVAPSSKKSEPALSFDDLLANSIRNKEDSIGRKLTDAEAAAVEAKLTKLLGKSK